MFAGLLSLTVSTPYGLGVQGLFQTGLIAQQLGAIFWALALGAFVRLLFDTRRRWIVLGAGSLGALALTHDITLGILAIFYAVTVVCVAFRSRVSVTRCDGSPSPGSSAPG